jgi:hypothetical protein
MAKRGTRSSTRSAPEPRSRPQQQEATPPNAGQSDDVIELESEESFPASDAPSWTLARIGHPARREPKG